MTQLGGLDSDVVEVLPGEPTACSFVVRNTSGLTEEYTFHVGDEVRSWTDVEPPRAHVEPGGEQRVTLTFRPPRTRGPAAGDLSYRLHVTPVEQPESQVVLESTVRVLPYTDLMAEISPRMSVSGLRAGRHELTVDNRGNTPVALSIDGADPDRRLTIDPRPGSLTLGPGQAGIVTVRARPGRVRLRGQPSAFPYQLSVVPEASDPLVLDATVVQRPLVPPAAGRVLTGLLALVLLAAAGWYGLVRPAATEAAREAAREEVRPVAQRAQAAQSAAQQAADQLRQSRQSAPRRDTTVPGTSLSSLPAGARLFTRRLSTVSRPDTAARAQYRVPRGFTLILTFVNLQNPWGARGSLELAAGDTTIFTEDQSYYRNEVRYLPTPIEVAGGQPVQMRTRCVTAGSSAPGAGRGNRCRAYVLLGGYLVPASPTGSG